MVTPVSASCTFTNLSDEPVATHPDTASAAIEYMGIMWASTLLSSFPVLFVMMVFALPLVSLVSERVPIAVYMCRFSTTTHLAPGGGGEVDGKKKQRQNHCRKRMTHPEEYVFKNPSHKPAHTCWFCRQTAEGCDSSFSVMHMVGFIAAL